MLLRRLLIASVIALAPLSASAWNALGHKVICDIAWGELSDDQRKEIADTLKRHPRYDKDFVPDMPAISEEETDRWIFLHAGTWPDIARGIQGPDRDKFNKPIWHYVNYPITLDGFPEPKLNLGTDPSKNKSVSWNVIQATNFCLGVIESDAPPQQKALAYSWLFHLVGDLHQPLHSTALFCERYPKGDKGGNEVKLYKGDNLHSLWDNLIGRSHQLNDVKAQVAKLKEQKALWEVRSEGTPEEWIQQSHQIAKQYAYAPQLLDQIRKENAVVPFKLYGDYFTFAGHQARKQVVAAGLRLAVLLGASASEIEQKYKTSLDDFGFGRGPSLTPTIRPERPRTVTPTPFSAPKRTSELSYWLNTETNVRHNPGCRHFGKTKAGRSCGADEGKPCGICGG